jgi:hypothetical protein
MQCFCPSLLLLILKMDNWNDRFWVHPKPSYNVLSDKHERGYVNALSRHHSRKRVSGTKLSKTSGFKQSSKQINVTPNKYILGELTDELDYVWNEFCLPPEAKKTFLNAIKPLSL